MKSEKSGFAGFSLLLPGGLQGRKLRPRLKISYRVILNLTFSVTVQTGRKIPLTFPLIDQYLSINRSRGSGLVAVRSRQGASSMGEELSASRSTPRWRGPCGLVRKRLIRRLQGWIRPRGSYSGTERRELPQAAVEVSLGAATRWRWRPFLLARSCWSWEVGLGSTFCSRPTGWGPGKMAYGLDMTDEMLELARENRQKAGVENADPDGRGTIAAPRRRPLRSLQRGD
jgi:hypothetical protein